MVKYDKSVLMQVSQVFQTLSHVDSEKKFLNDAF